MYLSNDHLKNTCDNGNIEIEYLHFGSDICMIVQKWMDSRLYYFVDQ